MLTSFAFAQPLFDLLGQNPEFFTARNATPADIILFAVVLTLALPAAFLAVELVVGLVSGRARAVLHLVFVGALAALIALHLANRLANGAGYALVSIAAVTGLAAAIAYARSSHVRLLVTVLLPVPIVFAGLFLLASPVSGLLMPPEARLAAGPTSTNAKETPVVLIVFDEFSTAGLMDAEGEIDAERFPNFAALAGDSTWFRNATTVDDHTHQAVPAILTGVQPKEGRHPIYADHPDNLFTLLARTHELRVIERLTRLCPVSLCASQASSSGEDGSRSGQPDNGLDEVATLASDVGVVYLHSVLPEPLNHGLPSISERWAGFADGGGGDGDEPVEEAVGHVGGQPGVCSRGVCVFLDSRTPTSRPGLYFVHVMHPHAQWRFLPTGQYYGGKVRDIPGKGRSAWGHDEWLITQGQQRYLLQVGYTDLMLGRVLDRLRAEGLYERSLVIVTADHGTSFRAGAPRRNVARSNLDEIAFVPLLVKLPEQHAGAVSDAFARVLDVLPTIADVLDTRPPWKVDGRSLVSPQLPGTGTVTIVNQRGRPIAEPLSSLIRRRDDALARQVAIFGEGSFAHVYRVGPNKQLIGTPVAELTTTQGRARVRLDGDALDRPVDLEADELPIFVTGTLTGLGAGQDLALALNGEIAAVTRSYATDGDTRFAALLAPAALRSGVNELVMFAVRRTPTLSLAQLQRAP